MTQSGAIVGTPSYMAPEQAHGGNVDHRSDLFSLGCVLYVMTTGQLPFKGNDTLSVLIAIDSSDPLPPHEVNPEVPQDLSDLTMKLLAKKPEDRPASAREVAEALRSVRGTDTTEMTAKPTWKWQAKRPASKKKRRPLVLAAVAVGVLALIAAGVVFFLQTPDGTLRVEINDPQIEVAVKGTAIILKQDGKDNITLQPGEKVLVVKRGEFSFETNQLVLKSGQTAVVKVELLPGKFVAMHEGKVIGSKDIPMGQDPDRVAAQWTLDFYARTPPKHHGNNGAIKIKVGENEKELKAGDALPEQRFTLVEVRPGSVAFGPGDVARFQRLAGLRGFATFEGSDEDLKLVNRGITELQLLWMRVTGPGLASLAGLDKLEVLAVYHSPIDDSQLAVIKSLPRLRVLSINGTKVTDEGLAQLKGIKTLLHLDLPLGVKGPGLDYLVDLPLTALELELRAIPERMMERLAVLKSLNYLKLANSPLNDAQLMRLSSLRQLQTLDVHKTKATAAGVRKLKTALPSLRIIVDPAIEKELAGGTSALAGPLDQLDPAKVPPEERSSWQPKELVAMIGSNRQRHWGVVNGVAISPDGKIIASGGIDWRLRIWDASTMKERAALPPSPGGFVNAVAFSADGKFLASSVRGKITFWRQGETVEEDRSIPQPQESTQTLAFSSDGKTLVTAGQRKVVEIWDLASRKPKLLAELKGHTDTVRSAVISPDGKTLATASHDKTIRLWDLAGAASKERAVLKGHTDQVYSVSFSKDGKTLASGSNDETVRLWDLGGPEIKSRVLAKNGPVNAVAFSADGKTLAAAELHSVRLWDLSGKEIEQFDHFTADALNVGYLTFSADSKTLVTGGNSGAVRIWDVSATKARERVPLPAAEFAFLNAVFSRDGKALLASALNNEGRVWDLAGGQPREGGRFNARHTLSLAPDGKSLATGSGFDGQIWDLASLSVTKGLRLKTGFQHEMHSLAFSLDGTMLAAGWTLEKTVRLWKRAGSEFHDRGGLPHPSHVYSLAFAPNSQSLATGGFDGKVRFWDLLATPKVRVEFTAHAQLVEALAFTRDGRTLASCSPDGSVRLWNLAGASPKPQAVLEGNGSHMRSLALSPDDKRLISVSDGQMILWEVATGAKLREWAFPGVIWKVLFAADNRHIVTVNGNGTIYILRLPPPEKQQSPNPVKTDPKAWSPERHRALVRGITEVKDSTPLRDLPPAFVLSQMSGLGDDDMKQLSPNVLHLDVGFSQVTDAGLAHLGRLEKLEYLSLAGAKVSDAGLPFLGKLSRLSSLNLGSTGI